jgi:hypothetical protein
MQLSELELKRAVAACRALADTKRIRPERESNPTATALAESEAVALDDLASRFERMQLKPVGR